MFGKYTIKVVVKVAVDTGEVKRIIVDAIRKALEVEYGLSMGREDVSNLVQDGGIPGVDIECRVAFRAAKQLGKSPAEIAELLAGRVRSDYFAARNVNGYLNFTLTDEFYSGFIMCREDTSGPGQTVPSKGSLHRELIMCREDTGRPGAGKAIIEFPSVNPNKPLHIGHLRNAVIGDSVASLLGESGWKVVRMDYIDDLGLQVAQSLALYLDESGPQGGEKFDHWLGKRYVEAAQRAENDEKFRQKVEGIMKGLEKGDGEIAKKGREMCEMCVRAQKETLISLGVKGDVLVWESDIVRAGLLEESVGRLAESGMLIEKNEGKYKGCRIVELGSHPDFAGMKDADKVFMRANGVATYTAKDTAFQMWKFGIINGKLRFRKFGHAGAEYTSAPEGDVKVEFNSADKVINVIGVEQEYPQKVIRAVLGMAGYEKEAENYVHISYGHGRLKEGKFSGRKGTWMGYSVDDLIREGRERAEGLIGDKFRDFSDAERKAISEKVCTGAVRYSFIRMGAEKELVFEWDKALNFEGDSGPYLQYSYARALRILENEGQDKKWEGKPVIGDEAERMLVRSTARFDEALDKSARLFEPHRMADYAITLCSDFNSFYARCRVIGADKDVGETRKRIVAKYMRALEKCLKILGIPIIEKM